jgi:hypothetical protein
MAQFWLQLAQTAEQESGGNAPTGTASSVASDEHRSHS